MGGGRGNGVRGYCWLLHHSAMEDIYLTPFDNPGPVSHYNPNPATLPFVLFILYLPPNSLITLFCNSSSASHASIISTRHSSDRAGSRA